MSQSTTLPMPELRPSAPPADDLGIDRAFILQMAQIPFIAVLLVGLAWVGHQVWAWAYPQGTLPNFGPVVVLSLGMILAALIDGICFKVPNWLTLSLVVSGWILGGLHSLGYGFDAGAGRHWRGPIRDVRRIHPAVLRPVHRRHGPGRREDADGLSAPGSARSSGNGTFYQGRRRHPHRAGRGRDHLLVVRLRGDRRRRFSAWS